MQRISNTLGLVTKRPLTDCSITCRFKSFVTKYNAGNLEVGVELMGKLYLGEDMSVCLTNPITKDYFYGDPSCMPEDLVKVATKTKHKWRFNLTNSERRKVGCISTTA